MSSIYEELHAFCSTVYITAALPRRDYRQETLSRLLAGRRSKKKCEVLGNAAGRLQTISRYQLGFSDVGAKNPLIT